MKSTNRILVLASVALFLVACSDSNQESPAKDLTEVKSNVSDQAGAMIDKADKMVEKTEQVVTATVEKVKQAVPEKVVEAATETANGGSNEAPMATTEATTAGTTEHIVRGVITQWEPLVTFAKPGDTVKFTSMTGHDSASMEGMIPEGGKSWQSKLGEEGFTITVNAEGAYVYKCTPHITTGMVGIIVVGDRNPANLDTLEANAGNVKIGGNMVKRAIRKLRKQLEP